MHRRPFGLPCSRPEGLRDNAREPPLVFPRPFHRVPARVHHVPEAFTLDSGAFRAVPGAFPALPEVFPMLPEAVRDAPCPVHVTPDAVPAIPEGRPDAPARVPVVPCPVNVAPSAWSCERFRDHPNLVNPSNLLECYLSACATDCAISSYPAASVCQLSACM
jgi:hypothetical protein